MKQQAPRPGYTPKPERRPGFVVEALLLLANAREGDWRAADALITRVYGKPQEKLEVSRPDEFDLSKLSLEEIREMKNRILSEHPELAEFAGRARPSPLKV